MSWENYEVAIDVTQRHTIRVRAQSAEAAADRAEKIFEEGNTSYEIVDRGAEIQNVRKLNK